MSREQDNIQNEIIDRQRKALEAADELIKAYENLVELLQEENRRLAAK